MFVFKKTLVIDVSSAVITFNDGCSGLLKVFERCAFEPGHFTELGFAKRDRSRVKSMNQKMLKSTKVRPKKSRAFRKGWEDKNLETKEKLIHLGNFLLSNK